MKILSAALLLLSLLLLTACNDPEVTPDAPAAPERISAVGSRSFGPYPNPPDTETLIVNEKFMTDDDVLQIHISPVTRLVWRIDLIIPQVPGDGDHLDSVENFISEKFNLAFSGHQALLPGTRITVEYEYSYGPQAVRCTFTDLADEKIFLAENDSPQAADIRRNRQARRDILLLEDSLRQFQLDTGIYPETLDGLLHDPGIPNWNGPYTDTIPADPWGNAYIYRKNGNSFELFCTKN